MEGTKETKIDCGGLGSCDGREQCSYWRSYVGGITSLHVLVPVSGTNRVRQQARVSVEKAKFVLMLMLMPALIRLKNSR